jgi:4-carboxymuconolactone decarboxylase
MSDNADTFDKGLSLRRDMFGVAGADQAVSNASAFSQPLQDMVTRYCFGEVWQRPGLDRKTRSLITVAMLIAAGRMIQLPAHLKGAIANGATALELRELILHSQLYCGIPAAVEATNLCESALGPFSDKL